jgi:hypothetical protein
MCNIGRNVLFCNAVAKTLYKLPTIKRILAVVMLLLFTLSITPKVFIHALVAHHQDAHLSIDRDGVDQLNKAGFHCNIEHSVVELPCLYFPLSFALQIPSFFGDHRAVEGHSFHSSGHFIFGLRGPPAVV